MQTTLIICFRRYGVPWKDLGMPGSVDTSWHASFDTSGNDSSFEKKYMNIVISWFFLYVQFLTWYTPQSWGATIYDLVYRSRCPADIRVRDCWHIHLHTRIPPTRASYSICCQEPQTSFLNTHDMGASNSAWRGVKSCVWTGSNALIPEEHITVSRLLHQ